MELLKYYVEFNKIKKTYPRNLISTSGQKAV